MRDALYFLYENTYQFVLKKLPCDEIKVLWEYDHWDGPLSGACEYLGEKCWFECIDEWQTAMLNSDYDGEASWYRRFIIVGLTPEQWVYCSSFHEAWLATYGCDKKFTPERNKTFLKILDENFGGEFRLSLDSGIIHGWFED